MEYIDKLYCNRKLFSVKYRYKRECYGIDIHNNIDVYDVKCDFKLLSIPLVPIRYSNIKFKK